MTALRPHETHKQSLLILLGLAKPPSIPGTQTKVDEEKESSTIEISNVFSAADKKRFCEAVAKELRAGVFRKSDIITNIEAEEEDLGVEIIPRGIRTKKKPSSFYLKFLIGLVKKDLGLYKPTKSEELVFLALSGKSRNEARIITGYSRALIADVYNALGFHIHNRRKKPSLSASFIDLCKQAKIKFYEQKERHEKSNDI